MGFFDKIKKAKKSYDTYSKKRDLAEIKRNKRKAEVLKSRAAVEKQKTSIAKSQSARSKTFKGPGTDTPGNALANALVGSPSKKKSKNMLDFKI